MSLDPVPGVGSILAPVLKKNQNDSLKLRDVAAAIGVDPAEAKAIANRLEDEGLIKWPHFGQVALTEKGLEYSKTESFDGIPAFYKLPVPKDMEAQDEEIEMLRMRIALVLLTRVNKGIISDAPHAHCPGRRGKQRPYAFQRKNGASARCLRT
ncbi:MAG: hypothetical protein QF745_11000 [Planctomycetota bacterium]|nr:hypothetical protein [Planctomycetota bacterium]